MNQERKMNSKETIRQVADDMMTVQEEEGGAEDQQHDEMGDGQE
jgi:hypothetical protein